MADELCLLRGLYPFLKTKPANEAGALFCVAPNITVTNKNVTMISTITVDIILHAPK